jgi:putative methyltransferase (TIGR04325 family)
LFKKLSSNFLRSKERPTIAYHGNYLQWKDAIAHSVGYQDEQILEKATQSFTKIISGEFKCERDTFLFDHFQYSLPLLLGLNFIQQNEKKISLLDFGGSFASGYFRNFDVLKRFNLLWTVVEQPNLVKRASSMTSNFPELYFKTENELNDLISEMEYNVVLFGSCLQFLQTPKQIVEKLSHSGLQAFVIERTPIVYEENTKLTVQQIREPIYESSYPAWHFAENELMSWFTDDFDLRYKFNGPHIINKCDGFQSQLEDYVFTRKK